MEFSQLITAMQGAGMPPGGMLALAAAVWIYRDIRRELHGIRNALQDHVLGTERRIVRLETKVTN